MKEVVITGGTGYMGRRLIGLLLEKGFKVTAITRESSVNKLPRGVIPLVANPFDPSTFSNRVPRNACFIQLLGVHHPGPKKKALFYSVDLASARASASAALDSGASHFIYVSVAQTPTKIMKDYQEVRALGEQAILDTGIPATFIRPWYVVGPGHYWPLLFVPVFKLLELLPGTSAKAKALQLVSLSQMLRILLFAAQTPVQRNRIFEISDIRKL